MSESILEFEDVTIQYSTAKGALTAVSNASFELGLNEYLGLVGESGCGKSTMAKAIIGALDSNGRVTSGKIRYKGKELQDMTEEEYNEEIRWKEIAWIPQNAMESLDPLQKISTQAVKIGKVHTDLPEDEILDRFRHLFDIVGLPENRITDYPHEFSGGMQQRAIIALALFLRPSLIIADEPTTALDVIMQDQVLKYLDGIKEESDTSMVMITHDISLVFETCDKIALMHSGQVVESGGVREVYYEPRHPYTILLQRAFPDHRYPDQELSKIEGHPPETIGEVDYCSFADRCPWAIEECHAQEPPASPVNKQQNKDIAHNVSCVRMDEIRELADLESAAPRGGSGGK
jgi:oligopeptide/dipeptide ABC transporter ATP-binding protein